MFKNETLVVLATLAALSAAANSQTQVVLGGGNNASDCYATRDPESLYNRRLKAKRAYDEAKRTNPPNLQTLKEEAEFYEKELQDCRNSSGSSTAGGCNNAQSDFHKAKEEFIAACGDIDRGGDGHNIGCGQALARCECLSMSSAQKDERPICSGVPDPIRSNSGANLADLSRKFRICPAMASRDIDKLENEAKEARKALAEARKKLQDAQKSAEDSDKGAGEKLNQIRDQMAQEAEKAADRQKEAKRSKEDAQNQLGQQIIQLEEELSRIEERRGQVQLQRHQAELRWRETITQIRMNCHQSALQEINEQQKIQAAEILSNIHNRGGFGDMLKNVGKSDRQRWQAMANRAYLRCMRSSPTKAATKGAGEIKEAALKDADEVEKKIDDDRKITEKKIRKIRNGNVCSDLDQTAHNGDTSETALCQARRRQIEDAAQAERMFRLKMDNLRQNAAQAMLDQRKAAAKTMANMGQDTADVAREQRRLSEIEALLNLKKQYAGSNRMDDKEFKDALGKYGKFRAAAAVLVTCKKDAGANACQGDCLQAAKFLNSVSALSAAEHTALGGEGVLGPHGGAGAQTSDGFDHTAPSRIQE